MRNFLGTMALVLLITLVPLLLMDFHFIDVVIFCGINLGVVALVFGFYYVGHQIRIAVTGGLTRSARMRRQGPELVEDKHQTSKKQFIEQEKKEVKTMVAKMAKQPSDRLAHTVSSLIKSSGDLKFPKDPSLDRKDD